MKKQLLALFSGLLIAIGTWAGTPAHRTCGSVENLERLKKEDPGLEARMQQIENQTAAYLAARQGSGQNSTDIAVTIPVVFHVVYNTAAQNISDAQCFAQLAQLNLDYARLNTDASNTPAVWQGLCSNTNVQFCMAQRTPTGAATNGIERRQTTTTSFSTNDNVKRYANGGLDAWSSTSYLNLWVCNLSGGVLGYAQFPGGAAATDGVVLLYSSVGSMLQPGTASPYNLGRTATHEVGHWLNLYHIWGDDGTSCSGTDNVSDTPNQAGENYGAPAFPHTDACSASSPGVMFMNYMDYTDDNAMNMFTNGQIARMQALFATGGTRVGLLSSLGCTPVSTTCNTPTGMNTTGITSSGATLNWTASSGATSYNIQYRIVGAASWTSTTSTTTSKALTTLVASSNYEWQVQTVCASGTSAFSASTTFSTPAATVCNTPTGMNTTSITSNSATLNWTAASGAASYNVQYRIVGAASWTATTSTTTSKAISSLVASSNYEWQVQTVCTSGGTSAYSASTTFTTSAAAACGVPTGMTTTGISSSGASFAWTAVSGATSYNIQYRIVGAASWTSTTSTTNSKAVTGLVASSNYEWQVAAVCASGTSAFTASTTFTTSAASGCSDIYESNNTSGTAKTIATNQTITGLISSSTDLDWFKFTTTSPNTYIKITLTNLPADYDIRLYNSSVSQLAISQNGSTTSEQIIRNTTTAATYYLRVYGYGGVFNTTSCYNLLVSVGSTAFRTVSDIVNEPATEPVTNDFTMYPNPAKDEVNVLFTSGNNESIQIRVFDMVGKTILSNEVSVESGNNKFSLDLGLLNKGIYFVELTNSSERIVKKLILEK